MPKKRLPRVDLKWTPELAYTVGLITTDGNLSPDGRHLEITSTDLQLLDTFKRCLHLKNNIVDNPKGGFANATKAYRVQFGNVVLYDWLVKIGLMPNKSLIIGALKIDKRYFRDFLRGHLDGDGSIIFYIDRYNSYLNPKYIYKRLFVFFMSASKKHIVWLRRQVKSLISVNGSLQTRIKVYKERKSIYYRIKYSTKEAKILLNWIYYKTDLPCLLRKYRIARPFLTSLSPLPSQRT